MSRPLGVDSKTVSFVIASPQVDTLDQFIMVDSAGNPTPGNFYSLNLSWKGATVGDVIFIYDTKNGAADIPTATKLFSFVVPTAAGNYSPVFPSVGKRVRNGMWLHPIVGGGEFILDFGFANGNGQG